MNYAAEHTNLIKIASKEIWMPIHCSLGINSLTHSYGRVVNDLVIVAREPPSNLLSD